MSDESIDNDTLDRVLDLWRKSDLHRNDAWSLEDEARMARAAADMADEEAEALWRPLLYRHPEWRYDLREGRDPRTGSIASAAKGEEG